MNENFQPGQEPNLPEEEARCTEVLSDTLSGYAGIHGAEFDLEDGRFKVIYDPHILSDELAIKLVRRAGSKAYSRVSSCSQKGELACAACTAQMRAGLFEHYRSLANLQVAPEAAMSNGLIEIELSSPFHSGAELAQVETPVETAPAPAGVKLPRERLEIIFTALTLVAALLAYFGGLSGILAPAAAAALYVVAYAAGGYYGLLDGLEVLRERRLDVNLLMIFAALGAAAIGQPAEGAALLFLFSLSNTLQTYAMGRSRRAIEKLLDLRPPVASVRRGSRVIELPVERLVVGDIVLVRPGERFPIDGVVVTGTSTVDQSTITGESIPVQKETGDPVFAGTMNRNGALELRVTRRTQDTTLAKIVQMVEEAQAKKARTQTALDNFEQIYALFVLGGAVLLTVIPFFFLGHEFYPTFYRAMTWLVVASPCALVISTPASILSAIANGARSGVLFKGGIHLEGTASIKVVAFDKTGTLTTGSPVLNHVVPFNGLDPDELLTLAAAAESRSEHPLSAAIVRAAEAKGLEVPVASEFQAIPGQGVEAYVNGSYIWIGNRRLFEERRVRIPQALEAEMSRLEAEGQTVMLVNSDGDWLGLLAVADSLRPDAAKIIADLKRLGVERVVMLTGDNRTVAAAIAEKVGVDEFHAGLLPQDKVRLLKRLQESYGPTAMVGDGVNDAPALATAEVGVAMGGAGTDVALETADVVLMSDDLSRLPYAIGLARKARRTVWQNLAFSLGVIVLLVITAFGGDLPLPLGVVGHEGSTVLVVLNGLRLLGYRHS